VHVQHEVRHWHMEVHHAKQSCYFEPVYGDSAIGIGHRCIVGDISLGPQMLHVVGTLTSEAEVSKTMTYVWSGRAGGHDRLGVSSPTLIDAQKVAIFLHERNATYRVCHVSSGQ
jgi:hypothetical protein